MCHDITWTLFSYLYPAIDPARAFVLALSPIDTVPDFSPMLKLAEPLLKLFLFWRLDDTSACTSSL